MPNRLLVRITLALAFLTTSAIAAPTVEGDTISWPDESLYQIRTYPDLTNIYVGKENYQLAPGDYILKNLNDGVVYRVHVDG